MSRVKMAPQLIELTESFHVFGRDFFKGYVEGEQPDVMSLAFQCLVEDDTSGDLNYPVNVDVRFDRASRRLIAVVLIGDSEGLPESDLTYVLCDMSAPEAESISIFIDPDNSGLYIGATSDCLDCTPDADKEVLHPIAEFALRIHRMVNLAGSLSHDFFRGDEGDDESPEEDVGAYDFAVYEVVSNLSGKIATMVGNAEFNKIPCVGEDKIIDGAEHLDDMPYDLLESLEAWGGPVDITAVRAGIGNTLEICLRVPDGHGGSTDETLSVSQGVEDGHMRIMAHVSPLKALNYEHLVGLLQEADHAASLRLSINSEANVVADRFISEQVGLALINDSEMYPYFWVLLLETIDAVRDIRAHMLGRIAAHKMTEDSSQGGGRVLH